MFELVTEETALEALAQRLGRRSWLAVDTEFVRERTYWPLPCLLQLADDVGTVACVDLIALPNPVPVLDLLWRADITKVFHAASQDLELLYRMRAEPLPGLFDTQVAAAMLGDDDQIGYAAAVAAHLGIELDKAHTRTDWSRRPLKPAELEYAADDVRHLRALYDALVADLDARDRRHWLEEECAAMTDPRRYLPDVAEAWSKVKGASGLSAAAFGRLRALASWREETALRVDRPRRWILADDILVRLANSTPRTAAELAATPDMPAAVARKYTDALLNCLDAPAESGERPDNTGRLDTRQREQVKRLLGEVRAIAGELGIAPSLLATRRDIEAMARGKTPDAITRGWRATVLDGKLERALG